ncbi:hypothetical protein QBC33DRAFT_83442 [Phialemonium atrogriseum]|uniref:RRM domain-containing protein n=1 Tax=Phialemonium atrogriseum TaxID=1093897 RepID=A0AAJ0C0W4_9PEZI|nr:uncharacterized protein QBC33DRAFT_83442 [Phialemonium atrogriseum]KAK1766684.1 hypothetical protein QBC33DRAFT_83442 [Phialemonium atrogriseum]
MATRSYQAGPMPADMGNNNRKYSGYMNGTTHAAPAQTDAPVQHANHQVGHHPDSLGTVMSQFSSLSIPGGHIPAGSGLTQMSIHHPYIAAPEGAIAYTGYGVPVHLGNASQIPDGYPAAAFAPQYSVSGVTGAYASYPMPYPMMPFTPGRSVSYGDHNNEVPGLDYRRGSYSTTESTPATPFFGSASDRGSAARIAVMRSAYNTPSPDHAQVIGGFDRTPVTKAPTISDVDLDALLKQNPAIPRAVPAVFTPPQHMKTLEQCLENRIVGNRNVYIRGLHPTTDDELLLRYAQRFGEVEQSKAIIDTATGACKGFGFAKFTDVRNSENCIRGFYRLGYEVHFAKESFNARLKAEGDENSTNLYLSNLPKRLTETELNAIFVGYNVISSKILRDSMGNSRGVGFARFATREECEDIINKYHGIAVGDEAMLMQVRYADTPAQKELKRITAERRQFRTNEYNIGAYGTADVGIHPSIYSQTSWNRRHIAGANNSSVQHVARTSQLLPTITRDGAQLGGQQSPTVPGTPPPNDESDDESVTVAESHSVTHGSTQSSPVPKKEKA